MISLIDERVVRFTLGTTATTREGFLVTPLLRPRIEGVGALRGSAADAVYVDSAAVKFSVRLEGGVGVLSTIESNISVKRFPAVSGGFVGGGFDTDFPVGSYDTSGTFRLTLGELDIDLSNDGVCQATLTLINRNAASVTGIAIVGVYGETRPLVVREEEGVFPVERVNGAME